MQYVYSVIKVKVINWKNIWKLSER